MTSSVRRKTKKFSSDSDRKNNFEFDVYLDCIQQAYVVNIDFSF